MKCKKCQQETSNKSFCSRSCANSYNNVISPKRKIGKYKCKSCNTPIKSGYTYCSKCWDNTSSFEKFSKMTLRDYQSLLSVKGKHPSWKNSHVRNFNRSWNKYLLKQPCENCGYNKHVELCHITPLKDTPLNTTLEQVNHKNNIKVLCRNCHWEFDNGLI